MKDTFSCLLRFLKKVTWFATGARACKITLVEGLDRTEPDWSNTVEMLLQKGVRGYRINHWAGTQT